MSRSTACPKCRADVRPSPDRDTGSFSCRKCQHTWTASAKAEPATKKAVRILDAEEMASPADDADRSKKKARKTKTPETLSPLVLVGFIAAGVTVVGVFAVVAWLALRPATPNFPPTAASSPTVAPEPTTPDATPAATNPLARPVNDPLYQKILSGTAVVLTPDPTGREGAFVGSGGSGALIHRQRRLLLTTHRTTQGGDRVLVFFPERTANDELISAPKHYLDRAKTLGVPGKVVTRNPTADLALVELERVPAAADELRPAATPAFTGSEVYSVGAVGLNPATGDGTLWQLSSGTVRRRYKNPLTFPDMQSLHAMCIDSTKHLVNGDSGGPTVNAAGDLVGLAFVNPSARDAFTLDLDLVELQDLLRLYSSRNGWVWGGPAGSTAGRTDALAAAIERGTAGQRVTALRELAGLGGDARQVVPKLIPLLDDPDPQVREGAAAALRKIGDPLPDDAWCLGKALAATSPGGRGYALRVYGTTQRLPVEHLPRVVGLLGAEAAEVRALAAGALGYYGPDCKELALQPLSQAAADENPAVGDAAVTALARMAPYRGTDFRWLTDRAASPNARLRRFVIGQIGADAETVEAAAGYLVPALTDTDAKVRVMAAVGFAKWGKPALPLIPSDTLTKLLDDPDPTARAAAIRLAGAVGAQPTMPKLLTAMKDTSAEVRAVAAESVARLDLTDPTHGGPAIGQLLECDAPAALVLTFDKLAAASAVTKERVPVIAKALERPEGAVRLAALAALASAGPAAAGHTEAVCGLIRDDDPKQAERALDTLVRFGPAAAEPLAKRLDQNLSDGLKAQVCRAIGRFGADTPAVALVYLIAEAEKNREARAEVADAVAAINTDATVGQLRPLVSWSLDAKKKRTSKHPLELQVWAFQTMARLDPNKLSETERKKLLDGLKSQADVDPDATCRREASAALAKLNARVKAK